MEELLEVELFKHLNAFSSKNYARKSYSNISLGYITKHFPSHSK